MISKERFVYFMNRIKQLHDTEDKINEAASELDIFYFEAVGVGLAESILQEIFQDKNEWIGYFIYDLDFGRKWTENSITDDGQVIYLRNSEELYDFLIKNMEGKI